MYVWCVKDPSEVLAARLKAARENKELTQAETGAALLVTQVSISRFEAAVTLPSVAFLQRFAKYFREDLEELLVLLGKAKEKAAAEQIRRQLDTAR